MSTKNADDTEMSMEEILASIRRYVADDGPETNLSSDDHVHARTADVIRLTESIETSQTPKHEAGISPYTSENSVTAADTLYTPPPPPPAQPQNYPATPSNSMGQSQNMDQEFKGQQSQQSSQNQSHAGGQRYPSQDAPAPQYAPPQLQQNTSPPQNASSHAFAQQQSSPSNTPKEVDAVYNKSKQAYTYEPPHHPASQQDPQYHDYGGSSQNPHESLDSGHHQPPQGSNYQDSGHQDSASASAFSRLADAVKTAHTPPPPPPPQNPIPPQPQNPMGSGLESAVVDMVRPMIKQWIDTHLPDLVERLVSKEIEKITKDLTKNI